MTPRRSVQQVTRGGIEWWQHTMNRMVQCRTIPALLDLAYDAIRGGLGYEHVGVFLVDPTRHALVDMVSTDEEGHKAHPPARTMPPERNPRESLLSDPRMGAEGPGFVFQAGPEEGQATAAHVPSGQPSPTLYVALRTPDEVIGLLTVANLDGTPAVTPMDAPPLVALATALAPAVHNIVLRQGPAAHTVALREECAHHVDDARQPSALAGTPPLRSADALPAAPARQTRPTAQAGQAAVPTAKLLERQTVLERLDRIVNRAEPFALLLLSIDNVSLFKDTHGAAAGDRVLHGIAMMLRHICRDADVVARYSADEIGVLLQGVTGKEARAMLRRLQRMVAARPHIASDGAAIPVVLTVGLACYPTDGHTSRELIAMAEATLSAAAHGQRARSTPPRVASDLLGGRYLDVLTAFITAIDAKDHYTREHSEDVTRWALLLANELGVDAEQRRVLALAAVLHDIGKVAVPDRVLRKPGRLTREEHEVMRHHVSFGVALIRGVVDEPLVLDAVAHHHERWDGQGYPDGLNGGQTSLLGRVMQVADAVSAMRLDRPYRQGLPWARIIEELCSGSGKQFDPALVDSFVRAAGHPPT